MILSYFLDFLFPPQCLLCNAEVAAQGTLCLACWQKVKFIGEPCCGCCGTPFDFSLGEGALCGECLHTRPPYARARSVFHYDEHSRALVTKLKYADQLHLAAVYGTWLARFGRDLVAASDIIVPVPLHYWRFVKRRYNQSALLAMALHRQCGLPVLPDGLMRRRATRPQPGLTYKQRQENVKNAFAVPPRRVAQLKGKAVLLIDDVMTTSATLGECAQALLKGGAGQVYALTLARKVK